MGRTSHEVRGLKWLYLLQRDIVDLSHLTRGAWIEIKRRWQNQKNCGCRTSHEVRGLKCRFRRII